MVPGYQGHVPGLKSHGAARRFGAATKDTRCIMSQWGNAGPDFQEGYTSNRQMISHTDQ